MLVRYLHILCDMRTEVIEMEMHMVDLGRNQWNHRELQRNLDAIDRAIELAANMARIGCYQDELRSLELQEMRLDSQRHVYHEAGRNLSQYSREYLVGKGDAYVELSSEMGQNLAMIARRKKELSALLEQCQRAVSVNIHQTL